MKRRLFTLVELLVVIAIIAILSGLLIPTIGGARQRALDTQCKNNMKQVTSALQSYVNEPRNKSHLPAEYARYYKKDSTNVAEYRSWMDQLVYSELLPEGNSVSTSNSNKLELDGIFYCPADLNGRDWYKSSYALNYYYAIPNSYSDVKKSTTTRSLATVKAPSNLAILFENITPPATENQYLSVILSDFNHQTADANAEDPLSMMCRHSGATNIGYLDGHVDSKTRAEMYELYTYAVGTDVEKKIAGNFFGLTEAQANSAASASDERATDLRSKGN